jgi:hypothetical protein
MKRIKFSYSILILLGIVVFSSCREEFEYEDEIISIQTSTYDGNLSFPEELPISIETINIVSVSDITIPGHEGSFKIQAPENFYSYFYAEDANGNTIGMSYQDPSKGIFINDTSTAIALIMIFPIEWGQFGLDPSTLKTVIMQSPIFPVLVSYVHNLMINQPSELMDYEKHPSILNTAAELILGIVEDYGGARKSSELPNLKVISGQKSEQVVTGRGPSIKDIEGDPKIEISNPTGTPYGIAAFNSNKDSRNADSYGLMKIPFYVDSWSLNWWIIVKTSKTEFTLGDGSWVLMLSRIDPWYLLASASPLTGFLVLNDIIIKDDALQEGNYLEVLRANARSKAFFGTMINVLARVLGIASVIDPTEATGFVEVALKYAPKAVDLIADISLGGSSPVDRSAEQMIKWILRIIYDNMDKIVEWSSKYGVDISSKYIQKGIENVTVVLDCVGAAGDIVQLIALAVDSFVAEQDIVYTIKQSDGNATITESRPPEKPTIIGETNCTINESYSYQLTSIDPEGDAIKYYIHYGDGTSDESPQVQSGTTYTFQHSWNTGTFSIYVYAVDINGATSTMTTPLKVTATPAGDFIETFESYSYGDLLDDDVWQIRNDEPSKILISKVAYEGIKAARFFDYDPSIGEEEAKYASLYTHLDKNLTSIETFFRFDYELDAFGIRAWESLGVFSSLAYYVIVHDGKLKWVKKGLDIENGDDFIAIQSVDPGKWYKLRLIVNWDLRTYDIYLDNTLIKSGADFIATSSGSTITNAPYLQLVAFTDASCRSFYIDNLYVKGAQASYPGLKSSLNVSTLDSVINKIDASD